MCKEHPFAKIATYLTPNVFFNTNTAKVKGVAQLAQSLPPRRRHEAREKLCKSLQSSSYVTHIAAANEMSAKIISKSLSWETLDVAWMFCLQAIRCTDPLHSFIAFCTFTIFHLSNSSHFNWCSTSVQLGSEHLARANRSTTSYDVRWFCDEFNVSAKFLSESSLGLPVLQHMQIWECFARIWHTEVPSIFERERGHWHS